MTKKAITKKTRIPTRPRPPQFMEGKTGHLMIIGGAEDKKNDMKILERLARLAHKHLVVTTLASEVPEELWQQYRTLFHKLGVKDVRHLDLQNFEDARNPMNLKILENAHAVFFTGGDQLRITSKIGGTPIADRIFEIFREGGTIAGTSAGASVMGETMLVGGGNRESHKVGNWKMAPGMGLIHNMIIDQHFAQRGRIGRLLGAVSMNPGILGIGVDEDTSMVVHGSSFEVCGNNAVYVVDGAEVTFSNISEADADKTMSMYNAKIHILAEGDCFDLITRRPLRQGALDSKGKFKT